MITIRIGSSGCDGYKGTWVHTHVGGGLPYTNATCPIITPNHDVAKTCSMRIGAIMQDGGD